MRTIFFIASVIIAVSPKAQQALLEMVNTERNFAKTSVEKNAKEAFLSYLSDSGLVIQKGKVVNGKQAWADRKIDSSELSWFPDFADIAASGDFGYTTGPWQYKNAKMDKKPVASGHFNTVWKKQSDGSWKAVIDLGISHPQSLNQNTNPDSITFSKIKSEPDKNKDLDLLRSAFFDLEKEFIHAYNAGGNDVYKQYISTEVRIYRMGRLPYLLKDSVNKFLADKSEKRTFEFTDGDIASSGDFGYVYGSVITGMNNNGVLQTNHGNYMRIWKREKDGKWKIVLDVINE
jgi:ketosteroid isomerase-like protein